MIGALSHYERWIVTFATLLVQKGILTPTELAEKMAEVEARWGWTTPNTAPRMGTGMADAAGPGPDGLMRYRSGHTMDETVGRLRAGIAAHGMAVLAEIDHAAGAARAGLSRPAFNKLMTRPEPRRLPQERSGFSTRTMLWVQRRHPPGG